MKDRILKNAERLNELKQDLDKKEAVRKNSGLDRIVWKKADRIFKTEYSSLAYPADLAKAVNDIIDGRSEAIRLAVDYLEADPDFYKSFEIKERLIDALAKSILNDEDVDRLQAVVLKVVDTHLIADNADSREFRCYLRLSERLATIAYILELERRTESDDKKTAVKASKLLRIAKKNKKQL